MDDNLNRVTGPTLMAVAGEEEEYFREHFFSNHPSIFTDDQLLILETTGLVTAFPSLVGSSLIIYSILRENRFRKRMYQRIMLGLSTLDFILSSSLLIIGPWSIPRQVNYVLGARADSFLFCNISGLLMNFTIGTLIYSAFLALFFALLVGHELEETKIKRFFEPLMHTIAIFLPLTTGIYAVSRQYMNPIDVLPGNCWMEFYCDDTVCRGMHYYHLALFCGTITVGITFLIVLACMIRIIAEVFKTEKKLRQIWLAHNEEDNTSSSSDAENNMVITRETCIKALLYIGAYILTFSGLVGVQVCPLDVSIENQKTYFVLVFMAKLLFPLQGFWNCLIYFRYKTSTKPLRSRLFGHATIMAFTEPHREPPPPIRISACSDDCATVTSV